MTLTNVTGANSTPYAVLIYLLDPGKWPFGAWTCTKCDAYMKTPAIGFGWPAMAPGASRTATMTLTASAAPGSYIWFASLYAQPLADVESAATTGGIVPGQVDWKIQTTITP
jgi:hypothetical protein